MAVSGSCVLHAISGSSVNTIAGPNPGCTPVDHAAKAMTPDKLDINIPFRDARTPASPATSRHQHHRPECIAVRARHCEWFWRRRDLVLRFQPADFVAGIGRFRQWVMFYGLCISSDCFGCFPVAGSPFGLVGFRSHDDGEKDRCRLRGDFFRAIRCHRS